MQLSFNPNTFFFFKKEPNHMEVDWLLQASPKKDKLK